MSPLLSISDGGCDMIRDFLAVMGWMHLELSYHKSFLPLLASIGIFYYSPRKGG